MRSRQYLCLVAEERATPDDGPAQQQGAVENGLSPRHQEQRRREVVGTVALCLSQPEALLPPPFPSAAPTRLYVSNMAVAPGHRRRGVARALLRASVRVGE